jgi:hypothetical protein
MLNRMYRLTMHRNEPDHRALVAIMAPNEREPTDSFRDESNVIGGWLPSLTFALAPK